MLSAVTGLTVSSNSILRWFFACLQWLTTIHCTFHQIDIFELTRCFTRLVIWKGIPNPLPYLGKSPNALLEYIDSFQSYQHHSWPLVPGETSRKNGCFVSAPEAENWILDGGWEMARLVEIGLTSWLIPKQEPCGYTDVPNIVLESVRVKEAVEEYLQTNRTHLLSCSVSRKNDISRRCIGPVSSAVECDQAWENLSQDLRCTLCKR